MLKEFPQILLMAAARLYKLVYTNSRASQENFLHACMQGGLVLVYMQGASVRSEQGLMFASRL